MGQCLARGRCACARRSTPHRAAPNRPGRLQPLRVPGLSPASSNTGAPPHLPNVARSQLPDPNSPRRRVPWHIERRWRQPAKLPRDAPGRCPLSSCACPRSHLPQSQNNCVEHERRKYSFRRAGWFVGAFGPSSKRGPPLTSNAIGVHKAASLALLLSLGKPRGHRVAKHVEER